MLSLLKKIKVKNDAAEKTSSTPLGEVLNRFLDRADLVLPPQGLASFKDRLRRTYTPEQVAEFEQYLEKTNYREIYEQLFGIEAITLMYMPEKHPYFKSGLTLGQGDLEHIQKKNTDLHTLSKPKLEITHELLGRILPDEYFLTKPERICEIGGAWGATIKHLKERFQPIEYQNYEPDVDYAQWVKNNLGVRAMPVDGETLSGTESRSMDMVVANNVFIFLPVMKIWSYMQEMKRVIRKDGIIFFNAIISTHVDEQLMNAYLHNYFPKRSLGIFPGDMIFKCFPPEQFELLNVVDNEYYIFRCIEEPQ